MAKTSTADRVTELSVAERILLVEELWDAIADDPEEIALTPAQRRELDRRLLRYRQTKAAGSTWAEVKARLRKA
jgi:putative addiction module component (TIGR02574 family)